MQSPLNDLGSLGLLEAEVVGHLVRVVHVSGVASVLAEVGIGLAIIVSDIIRAHSRSNGRRSLGGANLGRAGCQSRGSDESEGSEDGGEPHVDLL